MSEQDIRALLKDRWMNFYRGLHWGKAKENGIWIAKTTQFRLLIGGDRLVYIGFGWLRIRLMNPFIKENG